MATTTPPAVRADSYLEDLGAAWSAGEPDALLRFFAPDALYRDVASGTEWRGHEQIAAFFRHMLAFAPDSDIAFEAPLVAADDGWWAAWTWQGTAEGRLALHGALMPRSVKRFSVRGVSVARTDASGAITTYEDFYDMHAVLSALELTDTGARA